MNSSNRNFRSWSLAIAYVLLLIGANCACAQDLVGPVVEPRYGAHPWWNFDANFVRTILKVVAANLLLVGLLIVGWRSRNVSLPQLFAEIFLLLAIPFAMLSVGEYVLVTFPVGQ